MRTKWFRAALHEAFAVGSDSDGDNIEAAHYAEDALVLTVTGEYRGRSAIRDLFEGLRSALPELTVEAEAAVFAGEVLLLRWRADSSLNIVEDGVDTLIFHEGLIQTHTIYATLTPKS